MPAILDDPAAPTIYRVSGEAPYPDPANPAVPPTIMPRHVTLRDRQTVATVVPFASRHEVPESLLRYLHDQFNKEIEGGDTYPMLEPMPFDKFASYWFQNFGGIMLLGHIESAAEVVEGQDWSKECLGTFYIKPNYPGRSSHICNAGFIVTDASRNRGVGRLMGETYLDWAPKLGYKYSVFNLVYETNVASCKIWDGLGFKRIGRVKGAGNLKSHPDRLVDAIIYGRDLGDAAGAGNEELVSEERFDKIKFYLKYGRYPNGADRAEKSRLRSAATHYKLVDGDVLMLKDKEVISDPPRQYEIARGVHNQSHAGINKTTATIAERYHWSRIKETVSDVIKNCAECKDKDTGKASSSQSQQPSPGLGTGVSPNPLKRPIMSVGSGVSTSKRASPSPTTASPAPNVTAGGPPRPPVPPLPDPSHLAPFTVSSHHHHHHHHHQYTDPSAISILSPGSEHALLQGPDDTAMTGHDTIAHSNPDSIHGLPPHHPPPLSLPSLATDYQPIDPQIISQSHHHHYPFSHHPPSPPPHSSHSPHEHHHHHQPPDHEVDVDADADTFQALLNAAAGPDSDSEEDDRRREEEAHSHSHSSGSHTTTTTNTQKRRRTATTSSSSAREQPDEEEQGRAEAAAQEAEAAVDRDLEMLIEQVRDGRDDRDGRGEEDGGGTGAMDVDLDEAGAGGVGGRRSVSGLLMKMGDEGERRAEGRVG